MINYLEYEVAHCILLKFKLFKQLIANSFLQLSEQILNKIKNNMLFLVFAEVFHKKKKLYQIFKNIFVMLTSR